MTNQPLASPRRLGVALLTILCLISPVLLAQAVSGPSAAATSTAYDHTVHESDCTLLGREFVPHQGCSRTHCLEGAVLWRKTYGAEACTLRGAKQGFGYAATVDVRLCKALGRRWISQVNYCASEPDRSFGATYNAAQCTGGATVYVPLEETLGFYDECITLARAAELAVQAGNDGSTLEAEVSLRSAVQCPFRPGQVFVNGVCAADPAFHAAGGGVVMIGDSLTWRGSDELERLRPTFTIDGEPARPPTELASRLAFYRSGHGDPSGLIIELGTAPGKTYTRQDLSSVVQSLPTQTRIMFVLPYYELNDHPLVISPQSTRVAGWMRDLGHSRPKSCVADWPSYVQAHAGLLQDGAHVKHRSEGSWAHWISEQWDRC